MALTESGERGDALAARIGAVLLTADARLAHAPKLPCAVEIVS